MPAGEFTRPDWPKYATQWTFNLFYAILPANEIERDASRGSLSHLLLSIRWRCNSQMQCRYVMEVSYVLDVPTSWGTNYSKLYALWIATNARCTCLSQLWLVQCSSASTVFQWCPHGPGTEPAEWLYQRSARYVLRSASRLNQSLSTRYEWFRAWKLLPATTAATTGAGAWPQRVSNSASYRLCPFADWRRLHCRIFLSLQRSRPADGCHHAYRPPRHAFGQANF